MPHDIWYHKHIERWVEWQLIAEIRVVHFPGICDFIVLDRQLFWKYLNEIVFQK